MEVFVTRRGTPLASNNLRKRQLHPASQRLGLGSINWHSLRHTQGRCSTSKELLYEWLKAQLGKHSIRAQFVHSRQFASAIEVQFR